MFCLFVHISFTANGFKFHTVRLTDTMIKVIENVTSQESFSYNIKGQLFYK